MSGHSREGGSLIIHHLFILMWHNVTLLCILRKLRKFCFFLFPVSVRIYFTMFLFYFGNSKCCTRQGYELGTQVCGRYKWKRGLEFHIPENDLGYEYKIITVLWGVGGMTKIPIWVTLCHRKGASHNEQVCVFDNPVIMLISG